MHRTPRPSRQRTTWSLLITALAAAVVLALGSTAPASAADATTRIVNGQNVSQANFDDRWPMIVALWAPRAPTQYEGQFCGGSLIDDQHVLTAAHCLESGKGYISSPGSLRVIANTRILSTTGKGTGEQAPRTVRDVFVHPDFTGNQSGGLENDVAVLRLSAPVAGASTIGLVQPGDDALWAPGDTGWVAGWGNTDPLFTTPNPFLPLLQEVDVPIRSDAQCAATVSGGYGFALDRPTSVCAGTLQTSPTNLGKDSCQGDSGGPFIVDAGGGTWKQAGIVSWGFGCAQRTFGVYTEVDWARPWVDSIPGATDDAATTASSGGPGDLRPPTGLAKTGSTYSSVALDWDAPAGGTAPERYGVWIRTGDYDALLGITTATQFNATGLQPISRASSSRFLVRGMDSDDSSGAASSVLLASPRIDAVNPGRPGRPRVTRRGFTSVSLVWAAASDAQSGVAGYVVERRIRGSRRWVRAGESNGSRPALTASRLRPGATYVFRVRAFDRAGRAGRFSMVSAAVTTRR